MEQEMRVTKRDGALEEVSFDKILKRVKKLGTEIMPVLSINYSQLIMKVIDQLYDKIPTTVIDELTAEQCASLCTKHLDYGILANRIIVSNNHKNTSSSFHFVMEQLYNFKDVHGEHKPLLSHYVWSVISKHHELFESMIDYSRDYLFDYFGFKTLERAYLMRIHKKIVERPQHMWMRVSIGLHGDNLEKVKETYDLMSQKYFTHATPTLFNAGTPRPQLSSCFLIGLESDSIDGIYNTLKECANISKWAGGIGLHIHNIRATGTHINGTNGTSNGIVPMLRVFNSTARYVDQCFTPDTLVYTLQGPKKICDIGIGDKILNSNGDYVDVNMPVRHEYNGHMLEIKLKNCGKVIRVTPEHQIFALKQEDKTMHPNSEAQFCDAQDLSPGDLLVMPQISYEQDIHQFSIEDCYMYGIIIGSSSKFLNPDVNSINTSSVKNMELIMYNLDPYSFACNYLDKRGIKYESSSKEINGNKFKYNITIYNNNPSFKFTHNQLYDENGYTHIHYNMLHLPKHKLKKLKQGLVETLYSQSNYNIDCINYINHRLESFEYNDKLYTGIEDIKHINYNGVVHDFEVEDPHDYVVAGLGIVHNGGGKRNGSFAIYMEPWHADIEEFLELKKNHGDEEMRARDLFYALWIPDLFMEKVKENGDWALFCPHKCPGLAECYGDEFKALYNKYLGEGKANKIIKARDLWYQILDSQMETGTPYLLYKDAANKKSNQKNLGTIKSSNLCVAPETKILTDKGYIEIKHLEGQKVNVWNGEEFSETTVMKTGENQELIKIITSDGCQLDCTLYHKFYIQSDNGIELIEAQNLKPGYKIIKCNYPVLDDNKNEQYTLKNKLERFSDICNIYGKLVKDDKDNYKLEVNYGYFDSLMDYKLMLQTCGINAFIPYYKNPFSNNLHDYSIETSKYKLVIEQEDLLKLISLGLNVKNISFEDLLYRQNYKCFVNDNNYVTISCIMNYGRKDDTYCFNEPKRHMGLFNGIITSQCTEIIEYSDDKETAVCNLASISLPMFVNAVDKTFNYEKLHEVTRVVTRNLDRVIDVNYYPTSKTEYSNHKHRPIGLGVQGLADTFALMDIAFHSESAKEVNKLIFETIYHAALSASNEIAKTRSDYYDYLVQKNYVNNEAQKYAETLTDDEHGLSAYSYRGAYSSFDGSPASQGILQFDLWSQNPTPGRYDWVSLKESIKTYGLRNSLLVAPMPTASTSQILGNNECFEPFTSNIYSRRTLAGEFVVVNRHLMKELIDLGLWSEELKDNIILNKGSIQQLDFIPQHIRDKYKIVWEIPMRQVIDMAADRGAFICQSQSMNLWIEDPDYNKLTSMHFYSWSKGLKTGIYYLRRKPRHQPQQFTIKPTTSNVGESNEQGCEMCSS